MTSKRLLTGIVAGSFLLGAASTELIIKIINKVEISYPDPRFVSLSRDRDTDKITLVLDSGIICEDNKYFLFIPSVQGYDKNLVDLARNENVEFYREVNYSFKHK